MKFSVASFIASATLALAATPSGFTPSSKNELLVMYGKTTVADGKVLTQNETATVPKLASKTRLSGDFAVLMVDMDVPGNGSSSATTTLLHWALTSMQSANTTTRVNGESVFLLSATNASSALAKYIAPAPPAKAPLSHRYALVLVNHTSLTAANAKKLATAAKTRAGFDVATALKSIDLSSDVVAGTFFNVTNKEKSSDSGSGSKSGSGSDSSTGSKKNSTATATASATKTKGSKSSATASSTTTSTGSEASSTTVVSAGQGITMSRTAAVTICLLTVGAGFMGL